MIGAQSSHAQIYKWVDENGHMQFSDKAPPKSASDTNEVVSNKLIKKQKTILPSSSMITLKVRGLLEDNKFKALNTYLAKLQANADLNILKERELYTAYYAFRIEDKSYEQLFNAWVKSTPNNYSAYLARARYYYGLGWMVRGNNWASETKKEKMQEMTMYFNKAMIDIASSYKINDKSQVLYTTLINISNTVGRGKEASAAAQRALEIHPTSFVVRASYLNSLTPRWGGTYEKMALFIKQSLTYAKENPELNWLKGAIHADLASMSSIQKARNTAEKGFSQALALGEYHAYFYERGRVRYKLEKYAEALGDFNQAIDAYPENKDYYYWRARTYSKLQNNVKATLDAEIAFKLAPYEKRISGMYERLLVLEGYKLRNTKKKALEIEKYTMALGVNPNNADTHSRRARAYLMQGKNKLALKDLDKAINLDPNKVEYYVLIDFVLAKTSSWKKIITYWDKFIALNPESGQAYRNRGGAFYRMGDMKSAIKDAKKSANLGDLAGKQIYEKFRVQE